MIAQIHVAVFYLLLALSLTLSIAGFVLRLGNNSDFFCADGSDCTSEAELPDTIQNVDELMEVSYIRSATFLGYLTIAVAITLMMFPKGNSGGKLPYYTINLILFYILAVCVIGLCLGGLTNVLTLYSNYHDTEGADYDQAAIKKMRMERYYNNAPYPLALSMVAIAIALVMAPMMKD